MFGLIKNNIKTKIGIVLPASYPASRVSHESVSVTADGVKTYSQLFDALFALVDFSKLTVRSMLMIDKNPFYCMEIRNGTQIVYTLFDYNTSNNQSRGLKIIMKSTSSVYHAQNDGDYSASVASNGKVITIYY